jgi:uncharacterized phage protein (TIGR01671 family)
MNRPIKFRAFNPETLLMYQISRIDFSGYKNNPGWVRLETEGEHPSCYADEVKLMQFTGLLDKNGKEIYEGDVLWGHYFVEWLSEDNFNGYYAVKNGNPKHYVALPYYPDLEIIGNIYENPELK